MAGCQHDHEHDSCTTSLEDDGLSYSLYMKIDFTKVECFNESEDGMGSKVFKPWEERLDRSKYVESDVDEELLFYVPFSGNVKLKSIKVIGGGEGSHPSELRIFKNRPPLGFDEVRGEPDQVIQLVEDNDGSVEYKVKTLCFSSVQTLLLHFSRNFGAETSVIYYIGMKGEFSKSHKHGVTICTYEARPNPADHKAEQEHSSTSFVQ